MSVAGNVQISGSTFSSNVATGGPSLQIGTAGQLLSPIHDQYQRQHDQR
jgi:hypothetical protein